MGHIDYQGKKVVFYSTGEQGPCPLVLLHGFCEDSRIWESWMELLPARHQVIRIDLPGFGQSELPENLSICLLYTSMIKASKANLFLPQIQQNDS